MVISLTSHCLIAARDALENGVALPVHRLPPNLRQTILDVVLMRGAINNSNCLSILSSAEFLSDLSSLDTQLGCTEDNEYLERVANSLATVTATGETIGAGIKKLSLNLYGNLYHDCSFPFIQKGEATNLHGAVRVLSQCRSLAKLDLRLMKEFVYTMGVRVWNNGTDGGVSEENAVSRNIFFRQPTGGGLLNRVAELEPCSTILENVEELSLTGYDNDGCFARASFLTDAFPVIEFKRLSSLRLINCKIDRPAWRSLLQSISRTMTDLQLKNAEFWRTSDGDDCDGVLLFPMPLLKSLNVEGQPPRIADRFCTVQFMKGVEQSPRLRRISLGLNQQSMDEESLMALSRVSIPARFKLSLFLGFNNTYGEMEFDDSRFRLVAALGEKIENIRIYINKWDPKVTTALNHVIATCRNLMAFCLVIENGPESSLEGEMIRSALASLFGDRRRGSKLREITLMGKFLNDCSSIFDLLFENCLDLDYLVIGGCQHLRDSHFIEWARLGGGRLKEICLQDCRNVSDDGFIPILVNSAERLTRFELHFRGDGVTDRTYRSLIEHCRNVKRIRPKPAHLHDLFCSKLFNRLVD